MPDSLTARRETVGGRLVKVYSDPGTMARATAEFIVGEARRAVETRGRFTLALAGGATPRQTYESLAQPAFAHLMPWERVEVFWTDERCVEPEDPRSNEWMARAAFLDQVPLTPDHIHPIRCGPGCAHDGAPDPAGAESAACEGADRYDRLLGAHFPAHGEPGAPGVDLILLGLGENGHTASLFPGSAALGERGRAATAVFVDAEASRDTTAAEDLWRITMTASFINRAASVAFLVSGAAKAWAVKEVLEGPRDSTRLPAQSIAPYGGILRWHLDAGAAALLAAGTEGS